MSDITLENLKAKVIELEKERVDTSNKISNLKLGEQQLLINLNRVLGGMQVAGELMAEIVGKEEAQKIINEIQGVK